MSAGREPIAIVGMSGRFPAAPTLERFWENLVAGHEAIERIPEPLIEARRGPDGELPPNFVPMGSRLADTEWFDHRHFGLSHRDARLMDPQQRLFVEHTWTAIEDAGYDPRRLGDEVAVYTGGGPSRHVLDALDAFGHDGGTLFEVVATGVASAMAMRVSHLFGFTGESVYLYTACSTSLVAVDLACRALLDGRADVAIAGGTALWLPQQEGWDYVEGMILSRDGHCRAFDADATGTVWGCGVGVVVLKRLSDAVRDRDPIRAIVRGSAQNNDGGAGKKSFAAPSSEGQARAIRRAYAEAELAPSSVSFVEAHGTGTPIGDPEEIVGLHAVFGRGRGERTIALGSVKTNIGHLDPAAGVAALVKTVLSLEQRMIPPTLHFERPNPAIDFAAGPFHVTTRPIPWVAAPGAPRRAGINSFGVGGANCHLIVDEAPSRPGTPSVSGHQVVPLSARTEGALTQMAEALADAVERDPGLDLADIAYTHAVGRTVFPVRAPFVAADRPGLVRALRNRLAPVHASTAPRVAFLFPGQGAQTVQMAGDLYRSEPSFRQDLDDCAALVEHEIDVDIRDLLYGNPAESGEAETALARTSIAQPTLFAVCFALARWWMDAGVRPTALLGHSVGELVCACLADVMSPATAIALVAARGQLMERCPEGRMLAVALSESAALELAGPGIDLAAVNGPRQCVVSGEPAAIDALARKLAAAGVETATLRTSRAFHAAAMQPAADAFAARVRGVRLSPPTLPFVSNVTGRWIEDDEATDPTYWARQLRQPVRFCDGLATLRSAGHRVLIEVGPGRTLSRLAGEDASRPKDEVCLPSLRLRRNAGTDHEVLLGSLGAAWAHGVDVRWDVLHDGQRRRVRLPSYPFERVWCALYAPGDEYALVQKALGAQRLGLGADRPAPRAIEPPSDDERRIAEVFARALGVGEIGPDDDAVELGIHSLMMVSITNQLRAALGVNLPLALVFEHPTPRALAAKVAELRALPAEPDPT